MFAPFPRKTWRQVLSEFLQRICDKVNPNYDYWLQRRFRAAYIDVHAKQVVLTWLDKPVDMETFNLQLKSLEFHVMKDTPYEGADRLDKILQAMDATETRIRELQKEISEMKKV